MKLLYEMPSINMIVLFSTLIIPTGGTPTPEAIVPSTATSFPTTVTKTAWTSYSTHTEYPNPGLPLFSEEQWVVTTIGKIYEPWLSAPTSFPYTMVRFSETTTKNEVRVTTQWNMPATTISLLSDAWTVRETVVLRE